MTVIGTWWDLGAGHTVKRADQYAGQLKRLGIEHVATMLTDSELADDGHLDWKRWTPERLKRWGDALSRQCIMTTWTFYVWPDRDIIDELFVGLDEFLEVDQPVRQQPDLEDAWVPRNLNGFDSMRGAGQYLMAGLKTRASETSVTSYPLHAEMGSAPAASQDADWLATQAYAYAVAGDPRHQWGGIYGPRSMQRLAMRRIKERGQRIICGGAAYGQRFEKRTPYAAMRASYLEAVSLGAEEIWYWSGKHILGPRANDYAAPFLAALAAGEVS
jgi:hypothetical protein